ncbi:MAG: hypothetical protein HQ553_16380 [Chloroflexi bacterium]|nr:hypothetical protein [Chloroflexota bacterium]
MKKSIWKCEICQKEAYYRYPYHWIDMRVIRPGKFLYVTFCSYACLNIWTQQQIGVLEEDPIQTIT